MTCDAVRDRLVLWADDDLPAQEALAVRAHLAECPACAAVRREVERLTAELHGEPLPAVPEGLRDRIGLALDAVDGSRFAGARRRSPWETAAFYLAAAAVIALVLEAAAFLSQSGTGVRVAQTPTTPVPLPQPSVPTTSAPPALAPAAAAPTPAGEQQAVAEAIKKLEEAQRKQELANRERALLGSSPPPAGVREPTTGPGSGKPPGTLAAGGAGTEELRTPTRPVAIELSFVPP